MKTLCMAGGMTVLVLLGILAGFFFSFSFVTMPSLDQTEAGAAIEAMQGINRAVRNPVFFVPFFLTPVFVVSTAVLFWANQRKRSAALMLFAGFAYLFGGMALTVGYHIPMNEALAQLDVGTLRDTTSTVWQTYSRDWTPLNTFRMFVCILAMVLVAAALLLSGVQETKA